MTRVEDVTYKWGLAQQILNKTRAPEQILAIFEETLFSMERIVNVPIEEPVKKRVWQIFRNEKLPLLNEQYMISLCKLDEAVLKQRIDAGARMDRADVNFLEGEVYKLIVQLESLFRRRELALHFTNMDTPRQNLTELFSDCLDTYQRLTRKTYSEQVMQRVWKVFYPEKILYLQEAYLYDYCVRVLGNFSDHEVVSMLAQFDTFHKVNKQYLDRVRQYQCEPLLKQRNKELGLSKWAEWLPEITNALIREGVF